MSTTQYAERDLAVRPCPSTRRVAAVLEDGGVVTLRPLGRGESAPQLAVIEQMSDTARWQRFLAAVPRRLPARAVAALSDIDGRRHVAWLASIDDEAVGVARWVRVGEAVAEVAFEVVDHHHGRGIGSVLLDAVATVAAYHGVTRVCATVHPSNAASRRLLEHIGLSLQPEDGLLVGDDALVLPSPARVDRSRVLSLALGEAELLRSADDGASVG